VATDHSQTASAYLDAGVALLKSGAPLVAYDTLAEGLRQFPDDPRLRQQLALSLARTGASRRANRILQDLVRENHRDEETLGLLARTHKDIAAGGSTPAERREHLQRAYEHYRDAYTLTSGYWTGINAATMAMLLDDRENAKGLARRVREQCLSLRKDGHQQDAYWILATLGEAALILGEFSEAEDTYAQAASLARHRYADLASTRRNARLILGHLQADDARIEACLRVPPVVVFAGHLLDRPGRLQKRFPPAAEQAAHDALRDRLRAIQPGFGYASAACGGDILFLESMAELGVETSIVLPYNRDEFRRDSVDLVPGADWPARFDRVLARAREVVIASEQRMPGGGMSYQYGFLMLDGTAGVRADELDTDLICLALWDGKPGDGRGGTASSVERWREGKRRLEIVDLAALVDAAPPLAISTPAGAASAGTRALAQADGLEPRIVGLLFADVQGYTKLTEEEIRLFAEHFLGLVARLLAPQPSALSPQPSPSPQPSALSPQPSPSPQPSALSAQPLLVNTWGDGLYFVFDGVGTAGEFALSLCEAVGAEDWKAKGFRQDIALRIALHAGPVYGCLDPVTKRQSYMGAHVSHAARIEPITPPGEVYASGAFAALVRSEGVRGFHCSYVGQTPLARGHGTFRTFVVHRRRG
jgi:class 3 adenylate cyclase/tetratricopeptide (TPR) repeat protein